MAEEFLRQKWRKRKSQMAPEWKDDFEAYKAWCIAHGIDKEDKSQLRRIRMDEPMGPNNVMVVRKSASSGSYHPIPGYSHRPCVDCPDEQTCMEACGRYWMHYEITMRAYGIALGLFRKKGGDTP